MAMTKRMIEAANLYAKVYQIVFILAVSRQVYYL